MGNLLRGLRAVTEADYYITCAFGTQHIGVVFVCPLTYLSIFAMQFILVTHLLLQWVSGNFRIALKMLLIIYKAQSIDRPVLTGSTSQSFQSSDQDLFIVSCSYFKPSQGCGQYNGPLISTVT